MLAIPLGDKHEAFIDLGHLRKKLLIALNIEASRRKKPQLRLF